ncbi:MAG: PCRF domain-containing protein, partial [Anaerolineales bacterium]
MKRKSKTYWCVFDFENLKKEQANLQKQSEETNLWNNPELAQKVMKRLARLNERIEGWNRLTKSLSDTLELAELGDEEFRPELEDDTQKIEKEVDRREFNAMLAGEY